MIDCRLNRYDIVKLFVCMTKIQKNGKRSGKHCEDVESEHNPTLCKPATAQMKSYISHQALPQQTMCSVTAFTTLH